MNTETIDATTGEIITAKTAAPVIKTIRSEIPDEPVPDAMQMAKSGQQAIQLANLLPITTVEEYQLAASELMDIKAAQTALEAKRVKVAGPLHKAFTAFNALFKAPRESLEQAETIIKNKMLEFDRKQELIRKEAEARQRALAQAEIDRQNREAAETARLVREATEKLEAEARAAEDAKKAAQQQAADAAAAGNAAAVEAAQAAAAAAAQQAAQANEAATQIAVAADIESSVRESMAAASIQAAAAAVLVPPPAAAKGLGKRTTWVVDVTDKAKALAFIAARPELHALVDFNQSAINAMAKAQQQGFAIEGLQARQEASISARRSA